MRLRFPGSSTYLQAASPGRSRQVRPRHCSVATVALFHGFDGFMTSWRPVAAGPALARGDHGLGSKGAVTFSTSISRSRDSEACI